MKKSNLNYFYNLCYQILLVIIPIFLTPYLSRTLGAYEIGIFGFINSVVTIIITIGLFGVNTYGYREIAFCLDDLEKRTKLFIEIMILRCILLSFAMITLVPFLFTKHSLYFFIMIFYIISQFLDVTWLFIGVENLKIVAVRNFLVKLTSTILIFIFVKSNKDLPIYFIIISLSSFIISLSIIPNLRKYINVKRYKSRVISKQILFHFINSFKLFLPQIGLVLFLQIDKIMLNFMCGEEYVAYYDYADKITAIPLALLSAMCTAYIPYISKLLLSSNNNELSATINKLLDFSLLLAVPMTFGIAAIASNLIKWYLAPEFYPVIKTLYFFAPIIIINACINVFGNQYLTVKNSIKILSVSYFGALLIDIVFNLLFIKYLQDCGAAIATCLGLLFALFVQFFSVLKDFKITKFFEKLKFFIAGILMFVCVFFLSNKLNSGLISTCILILIGIIIYLIVLLLLRQEYFLKMLKKNK